MNGIPSVKQVYGIDILACGTENQEVGGGKNVGIREFPLTDHITVRGGVTIIRSECAFCRFFDVISLLQFL